jgi:ABC-type branched-subunit amino acid transport system substrate-binding protein
VVSLLEYRLSVTVEYPGLWPTNSTVSDLVPIFRNLKANNYRCMVLFMLATEAQVAIEAAYQVGMIGTPYVWIFTDNVGGQTSRTLLKSSQIMAVANGGLVIQQANVLDTFEAQKFVLDYADEYGTSTDAIGGQAAYAYDAVYAIAYGIVAAKLKCSNAIPRGADLVSNITSQTFEGASTGTVSFIDNYQANWNYKLLNIQGLASFVEVTPSLFSLRLIDYESIRLSSIGWYC